MVESGWSHSELMAMPAREFAFWFEAWADRREREAEAINDAKG
jgi:hypothetical protein